MNVEMVLNAANQYRLAKQAKVEAKARLDAALSEYRAAEAMVRATGDAFDKAEDALHASVSA